VRGNRIDHFIAGFQIQQERAHLQRRRAGMRHQCRITANGGLQPGLSGFGKRPIAGQNRALMGLPDILQLLTRQIRLVERNTLHISGLEIEAGFGNRLQEARPPLYLSTIIG